MTSSLLSSHLDQIALCASSISDLPFSRPKQFTNALLTHHDITALIRDTEQHERALFSIAPPPVPSKSQIQQISSTFTTSASRSIVAPNTQRPPRRHTAVAAVLGGDLYRKTRSGHSGKQAKGDIDVELLLRGAEKLCRVYPIPGAFDRIGELRNRYAQLSANIAHYEERVAMQSAELDHLHQNHDDYDQDDYDDHDDHVEPTLHMSKEDLMNEEDEIRALEDKKRALQSRVTSMEKDIEVCMISPLVDLPGARDPASPYIRICHIWPSPATTPGVFRPVKMHSVFEIGIFVRREALDHDLHPPQAIHIEINVNNDDADVVAQTIFQLVEEICEYFKDDQNAYCSIFDTLEKRLLVGQKIYNGMKRVKVLPDYVDDNTETLVDILTNPDFCISDICKLRRVEITDVPNLIVNYLMVYSDFPDARDPEIYDGKSLQIGYRLETHQSITASDIRFQQSVHYQVQSLHVVLNDRHLPVQANGSSEGIVGDTSSRPTSIFKDVLSNTEQTFGEVAIGGELSSLWVVVVMEIEHAVVDGLEQENCDLLGERNHIDVVVFQIANEDSPA
ncbi:DASH complex, subunit Spc34 [Aureobasidium pullulans]|uniref:DASH complex subunit SPC34 n=1 Tax=Aureobasidium pullulans TaxID=5580 RepID=A0A4S8XMB1_AURPU|nr:DASH complex, subunit Spc34 [Aureobasidium pullulans]